MRTAPSAGVFETDDAAAPGLFEMMLCENNFKLQEHGHGCKK